MGKNNMRLIVLLISFSAFIAEPTIAHTQYEDYVERKKNLIELAGIFGHLHHIRRTCEPRREANIWRERMQNMIELEEPDSDTHLKMVNSFNENFRNSRNRFPSCNRQARDSAKNFANEGYILIEKLTSPLEDDLKDRRIQSVQ